MNEKIFANFITDHLSYCIACAEFSDELKLFNIITVHQKNESYVKKKLRLVSILTHISKIYETLVYNQLS